MKEVRDLLSCYDSLAHEETILFNRKEAWNSEDALDEKYREYLMPASDRYFSRLRPLFSFEVKTLSSLNNFSHVLFRDGILFLLRFFIRFKDPEGLRCKILIHEELSGIVPDCWKDNILFYKTVSISAQEKNLAEVLIHIAPDTYESKESLIEEITTLKKVHGKATHFSLLPSLNSLRGEDYLDYCRHDAFSTLTTIKEELGSQFKRSLRLQDFWSMNFNKVQLYNCRGSRVFNMDSFFSHHVLSKGGSVFGVEQSTAQGQQINLSPHHAMSVLSSQSTDESDLNEFLYKDLNYPKSKLFTGEPADIRGLDDYFKVFYYSKDLLKLSRYINTHLVK